jgi:hypothetical protein
VVLPSKKETCGKEKSFVFAEGEISPARIAKERRGEEKLF